MAKNLSFVGDVWVNAISRYHDEHGNYRETHIYPGRQMTWGEFLVAYNSGSLWEKVGIDLRRGSKFNAFDDPRQPWTEDAHGALVRPARDNGLEQPVTREQVYIIGRGLWCERTGDPNDFTWAHDAHSTAIPRENFPNLVDELDSPPPSVISFP